MLNDISYYLFMFACIYTSLYLATLSLVSYLSHKQYQATAQRIRKNQWWLNE